ncbi:MAG: ribosome maturation factor RimP [Clostridia bacterium]|nr:ribosome maturation factor RimP [Clostridia bacterium]
MSEENGVKSSHASVAEIVYGIAKPFADELGLEIWDIKFLKEGPNHILRIFIDKSDGITLDDCEAMSRAIDAPLDEADPIAVSYSLEVCSPGIDRELTKDEHFEKFRGYDVKVRLVRPNDSGEKVLEGVLVDFDKEFLGVQTETEEILKINRKNISHINLNY